MSRSPKTGTLDVCGDVKKSPSVSSRRTDKNSPKNTHLVSASSQSNGDINEGAISMSKQKALDAELNIVKSVITDIQKEKMKHGDAVLFVLRNSVDVQRIAMLQQLGAHHTEIKEDEDTFIIGLTINITGHSAEVQAACATGINDLVLHLHPSTILSVFAHVERVLFQVSEGDASKAWAKLYFSMLSFLPSQHFVTKAIPYLKELGQPTRTLPERQFSCEFVAQIAKLHPQLIVTLIDIIQTLAADPVDSVRIALADNLDIIFKNLPQSVIRERLITTPIAKLLLDNSVDVSSSMFKRLVTLCSYADETLVADFLFPVLIKFTSNAPVAVQSTVYASFGQIVWYCRRCFSDKDNTFIVTTYIQMCQSTNETSRDKCAFNFPAVYATFGSNKKFRRQLLLRLTSLCADTSVTVRRSIAAGLHELFALTPPEERESRMQLQHNVLLLMDDVDVEVREKVFNQIGVLLKALHNLHSNDPVTLQRIMSGILPLIVKYEHAISNNWRKMSNFIKYFDKFQEYFPFESLDKELVPGLVSHLIKGASALSKTIAVIIATYMHTTATEEQCIRVAKSISRLIQFLARSPSSLSRAAFVTIVEGMLEVFSSKFVQIYLMTALLMLKDDPLPIVRVRLITLLPYLLHIPLLRESAQHVLLPHLLKDKDVVVAQRAQSVHEHLSMWTQRPFDAARDEVLRISENIMFTPEMLQYLKQMPKEKELLPRKEKKKSFNVIR